MSTINNSIVLNSNNINNYIWPIFVNNTSTDILYIKINYFTK